MRIIAFRTIREFFETPEYSDSEISLRAWYCDAKIADWKNPNELKQQYKNAEVHYATKVGFKTILENNVYIDKLHLLNDNIGELITDLKAENFDYIIDLHNNLRTRIIKTRLGKPSFAFKKYNFQKI